jgi:UDP-N-acetylmuramoyl-L-alanyl-D-glutamate--2,6-diaminopimelate ligase
MIRLSDLLLNVAGAKILAGNASQAIAEVRDDSRKVQAGDLFVAVPGSKQDGRRFIDDALAKGAVAILTEADGAPTDAGGATLVEVPSARHALGIIAANRFSTTSQLTLTAVTGTNGKTTTTYLVEAILAAAGRRTGVIGTIGYRFGGKEKEASLTTPGALELHANLSEMKRAGASDVVMEASSIALEQGRLEGCRFRVAALTNVTQDHLDYHGTMEHYFAAKSILFRERMAAGGVAVFFVDDEQGVVMKREASCPVLTVSRKEYGADIVVLKRLLSADGIHLRLGTPSGPIEIVSPLVGDFNVSNILTAVGIATGLGVATTAISSGVAMLKGVPGRLEPVANEAGVLCVVDYAHTPDALERALDVLRPLTKGRLICVFGCGGDRDRGKRPLMGEAAVRRADITFVTSDNPRSEKPESIIEMIVEGIRRTDKVDRSKDELAQGKNGFYVEPDRWTAISQAVSLARLGDVILLAGKGHENYQIVGAEKSHFDDREIAAAAFAARRGA